VRQKIEKELRNWSNLSDLGAVIVTEHKSDKNQAATLAKTGISGWTLIIGFS